MEKLKAFYEQILGWKIVQTLVPIDYWIGQTVPVDANGMSLHPGVNAGLYKSYFLRENP